jgi:hypothetical protein
MSDERFDRLMDQCRQIISSLQGQFGFPAEERDDMEQEMAVAILEVPTGCTDAYCLTRAAWAAVAWLRTMFRSQLVNSMYTASNLTPLIDGGACREVWA